MKVNSKTKSRYMSLSSLAELQSLTMNFCRAHKDNMQPLIIEPPDPRSSIAILCSCPLPGRKVTLRLKHIRTRRECKRQALGSGDVPVDYLMQHGCPNDARSCLSVLYFALRGGPA